MSATAPTLTRTSAASATGAPSLRRATVVVGVVGAAVTTAAAAAIHAAGVSFAIDGEAIPLVAFAQLTFVGAVLGGLLVAVLNRRSGAPHRRFLQVAVALTALSCVPSVAWPDDATSKISLVGLHLLAALIIVPVLARQAHD
jgi:peptidoglycan/LPS O-acetylase OafA/YrhL